MSAARTRVLIVEDEEEAASILEQFLRRKGFDVVCARDGLDGQERFEREGADVIVTDLRMPRLDGYELIRRIRRTHRDLPIVVLTGAMEARDVLASLDWANVRHVLAKPIDLRKIDCILEDIALGDRRGTVAADPRSSLPPKTTVTPHKGDSRS